MLGLSKANIKKIFDELDLNKDGVVGSYELSYKYIKEGDPRIPAPTIDSISRNGLVTILWNVDLQSIKNLT
jgi:hypothetical protein